MTELVGDTGACDSAQQTLRVLSAVRYNVHIVEEEKLIEAMASLGFGVFP